MKDASTKLEKRRHMKVFFAVSEKEYARLQAAAQAAGHESINLWARAVAVEAAEAHEQPKATTSHAYAESLA